MHVVCADNRHYCRGAVLRCLHDRFRTSFDESVVAFGPDQRHCSGSRLLPCLSRLSIAGPQCRSGTRATGGHDTGRLHLVVLDLSLTGEDILLKTVFFNNSELRAGWRFVFYIILVAVFAFAIYAVLRLLLGPPRSSNDLSVGMVIARDSLMLLIFVPPALILGKFEGRTLGDYPL